MDRTLELTRTDIEENPQGTLVAILSAMLYPEHESERESFIDSYILTDLLDSPEDIRAEYLRKESEYLASVFGKYPNPQKHLYESLHSRESGRTGSRAFRGVWTGIILMHLLKPSIGSLEKAYKEIHKRYNQHPNMIEQYLEKLGVPARDQPKKPSTATLRKIWPGFKNASHLWGAMSVMFFNKGVHLFHPNLFFENPKTLASHLSLFLNIASFHRNKLIECNIVSTTKPLIKDPFNVWNIVDENKKPYKPIDVFYEIF